MVHFEHTEVALTAVVSSRWFPGFLSHTLGAVLNLIVLTLERRSEAFWDSARTSECASEMTHVGQEAETIESNGVEEAFKGERNALDELLVHYFLGVPVKDVRSVPNVLPIKH